MHIPVLLKEVIKELEPKPGETVLDATIDGGGHAAALGREIAPKGKLIGIDQDGDLLQVAELKIKNLKLKIDVVLIHGNFRNLDKLFEKVKIKSINKALFDPGISSWHLENSGRGFSFKRNEPLDMRYEKNLKSPAKGEARQGRQISNLKTAGDLVNKLSEKELVNIFKKYGEERFAKNIVGKIMEVRKEKPIKTTFELVEAISRSVPDWYKRRRIHFATKTFQALRIAVNDELGVLEEGIDKAWRFLKPGGRMGVISFHSLEDRIVKNFFRKKSLASEGIILTKKPVLPSPEELRANPRARSAKLRVGEKLKI